MRVLFWYCDTFAWNPTIKTLADAPDASASAHEKAVVAFIHEVVFPIFIIPILGISGLRIVILKSVAGAKPLNK
jgi:hypothetical protein